MNYKAIIYYLSLFCFPISLIAFVHILYSSYFDYFLNIDSYVATLIISIFTGTSFLFLGKKADKKLNFYEQIFLILLTYIISALFVSIPFYLSNYQVPFINSIFESFSGITGTGFSTFKNIKYLDPTLILWRSSSQWIGGLYFLIFLVLLFSNKQFNFKMNYLTYSSDGSVNTENNIKDISLKIFFLYASLTIFIFIILKVSGIRLYNSLNLSMTLVSAGGFLPSNSLGQIINSNYQKIVLIFSLLLSMINFFFVYNLFNKRIITKEHNEDYAIIISSIIFIIMLLVSVNNLDAFDIIINVLSSLSNSGLSLKQGPENISLYFILLTIIGGSIISNTSGIKLIRIYILFKSTGGEIIRLIRPNNIINQKIFNSDKKINNEDIKIAFFIFISFFISLFFLSAVLLFDNINFENSFKLSVLTLTNTTISDMFNVSDINFAYLLTSSKISLIIFMIIGKIELISIILLIKNILFKN